MEIVGYPNYLIYEDGRIWKQKGVGFKGGFLKQYTHVGYSNYKSYRLGLTNENGEKKFYVSRLVAEYYVPNPNNYQEVDHIDRNPLNNHYTNLRWADRSIQNFNKKVYKNNRSGYKNISFRKDNKKWRFIDFKRNVSRQSKNKVDMICYKFGFMLRIKAGHFN